MAEQVKSQVTLPKVIQKELEKESQFDNLIQGFSYSDSKIKIDGGVRGASADQGTSSDVLLRTSLDRNKWGILNMAINAGATIATGDSIPTGQTQQENASVNVGINTYTVSFAPYGHNSTKASRDFVESPIQVAKESLRDLTIPRVNMEFLQGGLRGASELLWLDRFNIGGSPIYGAGGSTGTGYGNQLFHSYNSGTIAGATSASTAATSVTNAKDVAISGATWDPTTAFDNGTAWNTRVNSVYSGFMAATGNALPTYYDIIYLKTVYAPKNRIRNIKGKNYAYVVYCTLAAANNILATVPGQRTLLTDAPETLKLNGWNCFIIEGVLVIGTPFMDKLWVNDNGTSGQFYDFGTAIGTQPDMTAIVPTNDSGYRALLFCGERALVAGEDWNLRYNEDQAVSVPELQGRNAYISVDWGVVRGEFRRAEARFKDASGNPILPLTYQNSLFNYGVATFIHSAD